MPHLSPHFMIISNSSFLILFLTYHYSHAFAASLLDNNFVANTTSVRISSPGISSPGLSSPGQPSPGQPVHLQPPGTDQQPSCLCFPSERPTDPCRPHRPGCQFARAQWHPTPVGCDQRDQKVLIPAVTTTHCSLAVRELTAMLIQMSWSY